MIKKSIYFIFIILLLLFYLFFIHRVEYQRIVSPNNQFYLILSYPFYTQFIPMMPGQGGDKIGHVELYTSQNQSCGRVDDVLLNSVSFRWYEESLFLIGSAVWDLKECSIDITGW